MEPTAEQLASFRRDGFVVLDDVVPLSACDAVIEAFDRVFRGRFETTVPPDEWRWLWGRDPDEVTRQLWNAWKSDRAIASVALDQGLGRLCARFGGWTGSRLNQDGCLWKPPGASGLAFHQDGNYNGWVVPTELVTCWVALDDAGPGRGTVEYARGSHRWGRGTRPASFHASDDPRSALRTAAQQAGQALEIVPAVVRRGGAVFHHTWVWHGSDRNGSDTDLRALALHTMSADSRFHPTAAAFAQGRFRRFGSDEMDESFYPILWTEDGRRSGFIEPYLAAGGRPDYRTHYWGAATD